jgi:hypothetical protein
VGRSKIIRSNLVLAFGNESNGSLLEAYGIVTKDRT